MATATDKRGEAEFEVWRVKAAARVESALEKSLDKLGKDQPPEISKLVDAMKYALLGGGKRLRPLLALAAAEAVGGRQREALPAAMAVEMVHAYSLIHDDLPVMDDDDLRRGRPTCHKVFGEATALLAGDALLTLAFETFAENGVKSLEAGRRINQAAVHLARAAGASGMVGGQTLDLAFERGSESKESSDGKITIDMVKDMERRKTGELMAAALVCGAVLAGGSPAELRSLRQIGLTSGLAFQIRDDLLNLSGDAKVMGKAVGSDAERGKSSFPALLGAEGAEKELMTLTEKALAATSAFKLRGRHLTSLIRNLVDRNR